MEAIIYAPTMPQVKYMNIFNLSNILLFFFSTTVSYSPAKVDTTVAFPYMEDMNMEGDLDAPQQPTIKDGMWIWPGPEGYKRNR